MAKSAKPRKAQTVTRTARRLPSAPPPGPAHGTEDRHRPARACGVIVMPHTSLINRIRGEFLEMPGLRLTLTQAQRLCGVERTLCQRVLAILVETGFLCLKTDGSFTRLSDGADSQHAQSGDVRY